MKNFCLWVISNETFHDSLSVYGWTSCQVSSKLVVRFQRYSVPWYTGTFIYYLKCHVTLYLWNLTTNFDVTLHEVHPYTDSESWKVSSKLVVRFQRYSVFGAHATSNVYIFIYIYSVFLYNRKKSVKSLTNNLGESTKIERNSRLSCSKWIAKRRKVRGKS